MNPNSKIETWRELRPVELEGSRHTAATGRRLKIGFLRRHLVILGNHQPLLQTGKKFVSHADTHTQKCSLWLLTLITVDLAGVNGEAPPPALGTTTGWFHTVPASQNELLSVCASVMIYKMPQSFISFLYDPGCTFT